MMKRTLVGALAVALALIGTGCKSSSSTNLERPNVTAAATDSGATLHLSWAAIDGATSYEITAGNSVDTTTSTSFDVSTPTATIEVRSLNGSSKSDSAVISCKVIEDTVDVFGDYDTTHANGFGFNDEDGTASTYRIVTSEIGQLDFYLWYDMMLASGSKLNPMTRAGNALKTASGSFDSLKLADAPGTYAADSVAITATSSYFLTTSPDTAVWSTGRNYAKASVVAIDSSKVTLRLGYQLIGGLRWLIE